MAPSDLPVSADAEPAAEVRDVVASYLNPPEKATVLWIGEKSRSGTAPDQPILQICPSLPEKTILFRRAGDRGRAVADRCDERYGVAEFPDFSRPTSALSAPPVAHGVPSAAVKHVDIDAWLVRNLPVTLHFTPTWGS